MSNPAIRVPLITPRRRPASSRVAAVAAPVLVGLWVLSVAACAPPEPVAEVGAEADGAAGGGVDESLLGDPDDILFWEPDVQVVSYRNTDRIFPTRTVKAGGEPYPLVSAPADFTGLTYEVDGTTHSLEDYLVERRVAGLLVVRGDRILLERYALGNDRDSRWISFSIAKSVVSMLIGAAVRDGFIESVDDPVTRYVPLLGGGVYDGVTVEDVLQMASGVAWNEDYADPESDVSRAQDGGSLAFLRYMQALDRAAPAGETFNYNTGETNLAGFLLRGAIGNNLSTYLSERIWRPFGMEADATWMLHEEGGGELGGCCISATLRDYARLGIFALRDGVLRDGTRVLPEGWMTASTSPSPGSDGYGYLWWLLGDGDFAGIGIFGQLVLVDPENELVIVTHSAWPAAVGNELGAHRWALVRALAERALSVPVPTAG